MINSINKKNGLRKVMSIVGMCFVLGLFSGCLDLSDETNENQTGNTTENITESIDSTEATSDEQITSEANIGGTTDDLAGLTVTFLDVGQGNAVLFSCDDYDGISIQSHHTITENLHARCLYLYFAEHFRSIRNVTVLNSSPVGNSLRTDVPNRSAS